VSLHIYWFYNCAYSGWPEKMHAGCLSILRSRSLQLAALRVACAHTQISFLAWQATSRISFMCVRNASITTCRYSLPCAPNLQVWLACAKHQHPRTASFSNARGTCTTDDTARTARSQMFVLMAGCGQGCAAFEACLLCSCYLHSAGSQGMRVELTLPQC
jgi:hypothetical protein